MPGYDGSSTRWTHFQAGQCTPGGRGWKGVGVPKCEGLQGQRQHFQAGQRCTLKMTSHRRSYRSFCSFCSYRSFCSFCCLCCLCCFSGRSTHIPSSHFLAQAPLPLGHSLTHPLPWATPSPTPSHAPRGRSSPSHPVLAFLGQAMEPVRTREIQQIGGACGGWCAWM